MLLNIVIIGAGPAGEAAAKCAAQMGASVTLVEKEHAGGLCLNKGCVPSKTLLEQIRNATLSGKTVDWTEIQKVKQGVVTGIRSQLETSLKTLKIKFIQGSARFTNPTTIDVTSANSSQSLSFDKAIIAAGTDIFIPKPLDEHRADIFDSDRILELKKTPSSILIVGGGAVGCEFACLLNAAGTKVTMVELTDTLLPGEDAGVSTALANAYEARGINVITGTKVTALERKGHEWHVTLSNGQQLKVAELLSCVGRFIHLTPLALEKAGIQITSNTLPLNPFLQTSNPNIYAAGDVTGQTRLAHAAAIQGRIAALNALGGSEQYDGSLIPRCLYSWPEVASVGKAKHTVEQEKKPVKTSRAFFKGSAKALAAQEAEGFVQIVSDPETGVILGAQIIGLHATELIHVFSVALKKQMTLKEFGDVIFAHPSLSEVMRDAARR